MDQHVAGTILCGVFTLVLGWLLHLIYKWMHNRHAFNARLPPGSMGLPIIGETFEFFKSNPSLDIPDFYKFRFKRYGPLFKTSLFGKPVVISMDMETNRFIFRQDKLFQLWYTEAANNIIGKKSITSCYGSLHKYIRSMAAPYFAPKNLKEVFLSEIERAITESLERWVAQPSIEVNEAVKNMMFDLAAKKIIGIPKNQETCRDLRKQFDGFLQGLMSFPLYVPGTKFYRCMQARKYVQKVLTELLKQRICASEKRYGDFLDIVAEELQSGNALVDDKFMVDLVGALVLAITSSIATILTNAMKILTDHPDVVFQLTEEHEAVLKKRENMESTMTWEELKSLKFTTQVTNEVARLSSNGPRILRKTLKDVQVNAYTIPAGWLVLISPMAVHLNPEYFEDPLTFNPWRWQMLRFVQDLGTAVPPLRTAHHGPFSGASPHGHSTPKATMDPVVVPHLCPVPHSDEIESEEMALANAVLAIDISPAQANPSITDVSLAVHGQFRIPTTAISVSYFHSDFIIRLATPAQRDCVLSSDLLETPNYNMILIPWTNTYKSRAVSWETELAIDIFNLPPLACFLRCIEPTLSPYCTIETAAFNKSEGTCRVVGFALNLASIPAYGHVAVQYRQNRGVTNQVFPVHIEAYPINRAPPFRGDSCTHDSVGSPMAYDTDVDTELGVDREVLREAYERLNELEDQEYQRRTAPLYNSDSTPTISDADSHGWESDRSWNLY